MSLSDAPWSAELTSLWQRIAAHEFGAAFVEKLMRLQGWTPAQACSAIEEYRRFCFLACAEGSVAAPSEQVDQVWHLHLTFTRDYWDGWCRDVLRAPLHHEPSRGGAIELARYRQHYADTLARYERWFGAPPESFWPGTYERFRRPSRLRFVDLETVWLLPRPRWPSRAASTLGTVLVLLAPAALAIAIDGTVLDWNGADFLKLYLLSMGAAFVAAAVIRRRLRDTGAPMVATGLTPFEVAYLVGGPTRCVDAAIADLLQRGAIGFPAGSDRFEARSDDAGLPAPLAAVHRLIRNDGNASTVLHRATLLFGDARTRLQQRSLLLDDDAARRIAWISALLPVAVLLLGALKIGIGIERERPVGILVLFTLLTLGGVAYCVLRKPRRTLAGDRSVRALGIAHARAARAPRDAELPLAVALLGTAAMSGTAYAGYHEMRAPSSGTSSSGDGGSSDSGGGSDGGGGGGCGGCGGGGD
jgi:uncharacterized protein (TIGR04222 family)